MKIYRAWIYPCCNSMLIALEWPQSSRWLFLSLMVCAGYAGVAIIHGTLTWITGSLSCAQMLFMWLHTGVWGHWKRACTESWLGRKSLAALGNWTCVSGMTVQCSNQLSYIPSQLVPFFWYKCCWAISKCRYICAQTYTDMHTCMLEITVDLLAVWFTCVDPSSCLDFFFMCACIGLNCLT